jgi:glycosyltransferase involved in cell wall biosynthesis
MGLKDVMLVFTGEDPGRSRYSGELWDLVLASDTADVVRLIGRNPDPAAAYAAATVVVGAAVQLEGVQRDLLEAMAMGRPVVASDLAAGAEAVLSPPAVTEDRMTGLRCKAGDDAALRSRRHGGAYARALCRPRGARRAPRRGAGWVEARSCGRGHAPGRQRPG